MLFYLARAWQSDVEPFSRFGTQMKKNLVGPARREDACFVVETNHLSIAAELLRKINAREIFQFRFKAGHIGYAAQLDCSYLNQPPNFLWRLGIAGIDQWFVSRLVTDQFTVVEGERQVTSFLMHESLIALAESFDMHQLLESMGEGNDLGESDVFFRHLEHLPGWTKALPFAQTPLVLSCR